MLDLTSFKIAAKFYSCIASIAKISKYLTARSYSTYLSYKKVLFFNDQLI